MNPEQPDEREQQLALWLATCDDALAAGADTSDVRESETPDEFQPRLQRDLDCIRLLRQTWGTPQRHEEAAGTDISSPPTVTFKPDARHGSRYEIGRFQIVRELGRGGFGVVFLALDAQLGREVALKVPRAEVLVTSELRTRFQHEARAAAGLDHPNIVPVHEAGEVGGVCYIASAYCPGPTLAQWLKARTEPVPFDSAARLVAALADGVQHAHSRGVLHRDLKPSNVLLSFNREPQATAFCSTASVEDAVACGSRLNDMAPRITDFGLAKLLEETDASQTHSGAVIGTPNFMAPEQAAGRSRDVSTAADVHALGATLYVLLTGRPPFQGESAMETLRRVESEVPTPPSRWRMRVPRDLETICLKCLEKEPSRRYSSAAALADDLRRFCNHEPVAARPVGTAERLARWCRRKPAFATLSAALFVVAVSGFVGVVSQSVRANRNYRDAEEQRGIAEQRRRKAHEAIQQYFTLVSENKLLGKPGLQGLRRDLLESALGYFQEFLAEQADDPAMRADLADTQFRVGLIQRQIGSKDEARAALTRALQMYGDLLADRPTDGDLARRLARTHFVIGELDQEFGMPGDALRSLTAALDIQNQLARSNPSNPNYDADQARTATRIATIHRASGRHDEALEWLDRARRLQAEIARNNPERADFEGDLAETLKTIAAIQSDRDQLAASLTTFDLAREILQNLVADRPAESQYLFDLVEVYRGIGGLHFKTGDHAAAIRSIQQGLVVAEKLVDENPMVTDFMWSLARCYSSLARSQTEIHEFDEAIRNHREARPILRKLIRLNPTVPDYLSALSANYVTVGHNQFFLGQPTEALASFEEALRYQRELVNAFPEPVLYRRTLGVILHNFGNESRKIGRRDVALQAWEQCRDLREELADDNPDLPELQDDLVWIYNKLGSFHMDDDLDEGQRYYQMALDVSDRLVAVQPEVVKYERNLSTCYINVAEIQLEREQFGLSRDNYLKALAIRARIAGTHPTLIDVQHDLGKAFRYLGELHLKMDAPGDALGYFDQARAAYEQAAAANPIHLDVQSGFGRTWDGTGQALARLGRNDDALRAYTRAVELQTATHHQAPNNTQYRNWLNEHLTHLAQFHRDNNRHADADLIAAELEKLSKP